MATALAADATALQKDVAAALQAGDCARALTLATTYAGDAPTDPVGAKLVGDAHRCGGDAWQAARAYQRAQELGATDPSLPKLLESLGKSLGRLDVTLSGADAAIGLPRSEIAVGDVVLAPSKAEYPVHSWTLLPVGVPLELRVTGIGIPPTVQAIAPLEAGAARQEQLALHQQTPAVLVIAPWQATGVTVELVQGAVTTPVTAGEIPAVGGPVTLRVRGAHGASEVPLTLTAGARTEVRVDDLVPGLLSVIGAPEGSEIVVAGPTNPAPVAVPDGDADPDATYGVPLVTQAVDGLLPGAYHIRLTHPGFGATAFDSEIIAGEITAARVDLATFDRAAALRDGYAQWEAARHARKRPPAMALAGGGGLLVGAGAAALGFVLYDGARADLAVHRAEYDAAAAADDLVGARAAYTELGDARRDLRVPLAVITLGGTVGLASGALGGFTWAHHRSAHPLPPWDPTQVAQPKPADPPAGAPAPEAAPAAPPVAEPAAP